MSQGIYPASNELYNIMQFDNGEVFDVVMQNTLYLKYWTNALLGDKHNHRSGSNHHPYHSHGFKLWTLGYGEGNFDVTGRDRLKNPILLSQILTLSFFILSETNYTLIAWNLANSVSSESDTIK